MAIINPFDPGSVNRGQNNNSFGSSQRQSLRNVTFGTSRRSQNSGLTSEQLYEEALLQGGQIGEVARELTGEKRSMLSTVGNRFKNAFSGFIDLISVPSQVVAGALSKDYTVKDAIKYNISVTDALFGETNIFNPNGKPTTMQKVGNFIVRLPVDVLTDPLTYLTFGASATRGLAGVAGVKSLPRVSFGGEAAQAVTRRTLAEGDTVTKALSDEGADVLSYLKKVEDQARGKRKLTKEQKIQFGKSMGEEKKKLVEKGVDKDILDFSETETRRLVKATIDSPIDLDAAKKTMGTIISRNPALVETLIDAGGIKYFGKTILSSQRIDKVMQVIPAFNYIDNITLPYRNKAQALFDTRMVALGDGKFTRLPEEYVNLRQKLKTLSESMKIDFLKTMKDTQDSLNLSTDELNIVMDSLSVRKIPADPRLTEAYFKMLSIDEQQRIVLERAGVTLSLLDNHIGNVFVPTDTRGLTRGSKFAVETGAEKGAQYAKFIEQSGQSVSKELPELGEYLSQKKNKQLAETIESVNSVDEVGFEVGKEIERIIQTKVRDGVSYADAIQDPEIVKLMKIQNQIEAIPRSNVLVGKPEGFGLTRKIAAEEIDRIYKHYDEVISKKNLKVGKIEKEINEITMSIQEAFKAITAGNFEEYLKKIPKINRDNVREFITKFKNEVGEVDIDKLVKTREAEKLAEKAIMEMTPEAIQALSKRLQAAEIALPIDVEKVNALLKRVTDETTETTKKGAVAKGTVDEQIKKLIDKMKLESSARRYTQIGNTLDDNAFAKFIQNLSEEYIANPIGTRRMIDSFVGKKDELYKLLDSIELDRIASQKEISKIPKLDVYFVDSDNEQRVFKRVAASARELQDASIKNFDTNLFTLHTKRYLQNLNQAMGRHLVSDLARNFGKWSDEAPDSWVTINSALLDDKIKTMFNLADDSGREMVFHPAVAADFEKLVKSMSEDEATSGAMKLYDDVQAYWKASVTSIFPMFHGRNAISNVFMNMADLGLQALNPKTHFTAMQMVYDDRRLNNIMARMARSGEDAVKASIEYNELINKEVLTDRNGVTWTYGELRDVARKNGVAFNPAITGASDIYNDRNALVNLFEPKTTTKKIADAVNPLSSENYAFRKGRELGTVIEEQARLTNFMSNLMKTGDVEHAAMRTRMFLYDYSNLTNFEKNVLRRLIPFYSFTRFNLEMQAKNILSSPGRIATQTKIINSIGGLLDGEELSKDERKLLPKWLQNQYVLKRTDRNGDNEIITGFGTPLEAAFSVTPQSIMGQLSPIIKIPMETATGYSFFRGRETSSIIDATDFRGAPEPIKQFIGYAKYEGVTKDGRKYERHIALRPTNMALIYNLPAVGRITNTLSAMTDKNVEVDLRILQGFTGVRAQSMDFQRQAELQERELAEKLEKLLIDAGVRGSFTSSYIRKNTTLLEN